MKRFASDRVAGLMERMGLEDDVAIESRLVVADDRERADPRRGLQLRHPQARRRVRRRDQQAARDDLRRARQGPPQRGPDRDGPRVPRRRDGRAGDQYAGDASPERVEPRGPVGRAPARWASTARARSEADLDEVAADARGAVGAHRASSPTTSSRPREAGARRGGLGPGRAVRAAAHDRLACGSSTSPSSTTCAAASASAATPSRTRSTSSARRRTACTRSCAGSSAARSRRTIFRVTVPREPADRPAARARPAGAARRRRGDAVGTGARRRETTARTARRVRRRAARPAAARAGLAAGGAALRRPEAAPMAGLPSDPMRGRPRGAG